MELVTGATGYVGSRLLRRLSAEGRALRALARTPANVEVLPGVEAVAGDVLTGSGLEQALEGCETAYYLVHSMESAGAADSFAERDRRAALNFAHAVQRAGVRRIVYLGGIAPASGLSPHLRSRLEVEQLLLDAAPASTALRASLVIGAGSSSFRILVRLVERLRVLPLPAWRDHRTQPVAERDAIEFLARTPVTPAAAGRSLDIAGPDVVSYGAMMERIAESMGVGRVPVALGASLTPVASATVSALTDQPLELVRPLMESLQSDVLPRDAAGTAALYGIRPLTFERAVERALAEWERHEPLGAR